ncbi:MAG: hypothetical protein A3H70_05090 [Candidatus Komeilibacteria bacterium RIFCSPLOWO2_02_FULL_48_11]|uniref:General secretion pathway GspH domain-containing protein n=1 Tax=Candidatus Komeilibacteria bacterium RIFCSPLOWO2_02_FULL_48_11 TaxID=1798553 RepID=A0A1G2BS69_9BACT|nr:MAG: hypothetical protein A3H70_05090 [Candidatus Komeilibacteria bacterium RIFCSPLOWO2_02_FULL_48_11]
MHKAKTRGITLIEFMVSIGIIAITLSLGAAFIKFHQPSIKLSASAQELRSALQRTRDLSLTRQNVFGIKFLIIENKYQLVSGADVWENITLPSMVQFYSVGPFVGNTVTFSSAGAASEAGTIVLQNSDGRQKQIIVSPSGYVRIE